MSLVKLLKPVIERFPLLAANYRFSRDWLKLRRPVLYRDELGFYYNGPADMENGTFEPEETLLFESLVGGVDVFINVGANTGYYVCKALHAEVNSIAFEPNQLNVNCLLKNIATNSFSGVFQLFPVALSENVGVLPLFGADTGASLIEGWAGQIDSTLVPVSTLDQTASTSVAGKQCLILIDIEGAELGCLKGSTQLLSAKEDNVFIVEICVTEHMPSGTTINPNLVETFEFMSSFGYVAYTADSKLRKIDLSEIQNIAKTNIDTLGTHNFLFLKANSSLSDIGLL